jgi:hypothetical protein
VRGALKYIVVPLGSRSEWDFWTPGKAPTDQSKLFVRALTNVTLETVTATITAAP